MGTVPWDEMITIAFVPDSQVRHVTIRDIVEFFLTMSAQERHSLVVQLSKPLRIWDGQADDRQWRAKEFGILTAMRCDEQQQPGPE